MELMGVNDIINDYRIKRNFIELKVVTE